MRDIEEKDIKLALAVAVVGLCTNAGAIARILEVPESRLLSLLDTLSDNDEPFNLND